MRLSNLRSPWWSGPCFTFDKLKCQTMTRQMAGHSNYYNGEKYVWLAPAQPGAPLTELLSCERHRTVVKHPWRVAMQQDSGRQEDL